jgi:protein O-mannosyl-transferase
MSARTSAPDSADAGDVGSDRRGKALLAAALLALLILTAVVYAPVVGFGFSTYDDLPMLVTNPHVHAGLGVDSALWALQSREQANWFPLTWLSHQLDWQRFGAWAGGHHATNVVLHLATVAAVFLAFSHLTGRPWSSLAIAGVFAVHPMNVESVAWIAERKNVLSSLLFAVCLFLYAGYARRPTWRGYVGVTLAFALGLLAKPMLVTLPCVLLLLDYWPLGRLTPGAWRRVVAEKLPWFLMSAASSVITVIAQSSAGAMETLQESSIPARLCVALTGYLEYLVKLCWPVRLAVLYPKPTTPCASDELAAASAVLIAVSATVLLLARRRPHLFVGWAWFVGMLVPVSGIVQVGMQLIADRYVYLPMLGLLLAAFWSTGELAARSDLARRLLPWGTALLVLLLAARTSVQVRYWKDDITLFSRALSVTSNNCFAHNQLGALLRQQGNPGAALEHYRQAVAACPWSDLAQANLGGFLANAGQLEAALSHLRISVAINPRQVPGNYNLGLALWHQGKTQEAATHFRQALQVEPGHQPSRDMLRRIEGDGPR